MTLIELADKEQERLHEIAERYKPFVVVAEQAVTLFSAMVPAINQPAPSFVAFYSQAKKHLTLAFFSLLRGHRTQYKLNLRYFSEALVQAGYAAFHTDASEYWAVEAKKPVKQELVVKRAHEWLTATYPIVSDHLKKLKRTINDESAHLNFITSFTNYSVEENGDQNTPFFDQEKDLIIKADLLECARVAGLGVDLLLACARDGGAPIMEPNTLNNWSQLTYAADDLFKEMNNDVRWQKYVDEEGSDDVG